MASQTDELLAITWRSHPLTGRRPPLTTSLRLTCRIPQNRSFYLDTKPRFSPAFIVRASSIPGNRRRTDRVRSLSTLTKIRSAHECGSLKLIIDQQVFCNLLNIRNLAILPNLSDPHFNACLLFDPILPERYLGMGGGCGTLRSADVRSRLKVTGEVVGLQTRTFLPTGRGNR